jgi:predicted DsbA family dithiol-disulfide isomerase
VKLPKLKVHAQGGGTSIQAAAVMIGDLQASNRQMRKAIKAQAEEHNYAIRKLNKKLQRVTAQAARFAELEGRHSRMSAELVNLGEKVGVDFAEVRSAGTKLTVLAFDSILAAAEQTGVVLNPQQRIAMKMLAEQEGMLDEGVVNRMGRA